MGDKEEQIGGLVYGLISESDKTWTSREIFGQITKNIKCNKDELERVLTTLSQNGIIRRRGSNGWCMPTDGNEVDEDASACSNIDQSVDSMARSLESTHLKERHDLHHTELKSSTPSSRSSGEQRLQRPRTEQSTSIADLDQTSLKQPTSRIAEVASSGAVQINQQSESNIDPEVSLHIDPLKKLIDVFKSGEKDLSPLTVSKKAKIGQSKKDCNPYLYHLEKKEVLIKRCNEDNSKPVWNLNANFDINEITERMYLDWAAEIAKKSLGKSQSVHHHHHHEHNNTFQIGNNNRIVNVKDAQNLVEEPAEKKAENSV